MKKYWVKKIEFLKKHLSLIILFPTTIGGLWQLIELSSISPSYIRFFSISQVVPDGLLVLLFIVGIYVSLIISRLLFRYTSLSKLKSTKWWSTIVLMVLITIMFSAPLIYMYIGVVDRGYIEVVDIFTFIGCLTMILGSYANLIPENALKRFEKKEPTNKTFEKDKTEDEKPKLKNYLFVAGFLVILILALKLFGLTSDVISKIRNDSVRTERLLNFETLVLKLKEKENYKFSEILYFNDKYIFVEYFDRNNKMVIEVLKNESLFE